MPITLNGDTGITTPTYGGTDTSEYLVPVTAFKNRIINGDMRIDQRNAGASVTPTNGQYTLDRWRAFQSVLSKYSVQQNAGAVTPPVGFSKYLGVTSLAATTVGAGDYYYLNQPIEGLNVADLGWGTASAASVTLSFWVRSSLTGTFGGSIRNAAQNRSYPFTYTISVSNTWEQKSITIAGDTTGTWLTTNGVGVDLLFSLGMGSTYSGTAGTWGSANYGSATGATSVVGTNGATFYITGVQLEKGSTATSFDYRPYGTELQLCQRYFEKSFSVETAPANGSTTSTFLVAATNVGMATNRNSTGTGMAFIVEKRTSPTMVHYGNSNGQWAYQAANSTTISFSANVGLGNVNTKYYTCTQQVIDGSAIFVWGHWTASAEL